jgi:hypothetical protein
MMNEEQRKYGVGSGAWMRLGWALLCYSLVFSFSVSAQPTQALIEPFNPTYFITDEEFNDANAMSCGQVQEFLSARSGILKNYNDGGKAAAQIICEQASAFSVNPRLLLTMMQKEMGLLTDPSPTPGALNWALGCGPGWESTKGFATNVECGARTLRRGFDRAALGTEVGGTVPLNRASFALMKYNERVSGSETFWKIWTRYFPNSVGGGPASVVAAVTGEVMSPVIVVDSKRVETVPPIKPNTTCRSGWGIVSDAATNKHLIATPNVATQAESTNAAVWRPTILRTGIYRVSVFVPSRGPIPWACGKLAAVYDTTRATYEIKHRDGVTIYAINQEPIHDGWVELGTYYFAAGTEGYVKVSDVTGEPANSRWVSIDEAKWEWVFSGGS